MSLKNDHQISIRYTLYISQFKLSVLVQNHLKVHDIILYPADNWNYKIIIHLSLYLWIIL